MNRFPGPEKTWDDAVVGETGTSPTVTVTGAMIDTYADLSGDRTPLHVDEAYAKKSHFGGRVAHGLMGLSIADGLKCQADLRFLPGYSLGWTWDFLAPIRIGDTLHVRFSVSSKRASKSKPGWGIVVIPTELVNQRGEVVQHGEHKLMIPRRPGAT
ncbi:MAG: MaoC family dehydratase [Burkholderiales bacterium]|nr:MaoC family dehydratase [Burkholderiales bacterium]MCC7113837.1 MaoC family dehydratase [Burkholderiales bacterium]